MWLVKRRVVVIVCVVAVVLICAGIMALRLRRRAALYDVTVLVTPGGEAILPSSINDHGQIVGFVPRPGDQYGIVLWDREEGDEELTCFDGWHPVNPFKINDAGQIAGGIKDPNGMYRAFLWDRTNGLRMLETLCGLMSEVQAINDQGAMAGYSQTSNRKRHAVLWTQEGGLIDLGTLGGSESHVGGINNRGEVVGFSQVASGQWHAFFWDPNGGMKDIGATSLEWPAGDHIRINNHGLVVGRFGSATDEMLISTWSATKGIGAVPSLEGLDAFPYGLNDVGQLLVHVRSQSLMGLVTRIEAYLWTPGRGFVSLEERTGTVRGGILYLRDINDEGRIVGLWLRGRGKNRGVLMTPVVEEADGGTEGTR